jgi:hypothetical protein
MHNGIVIYTNHYVHFENENEWLFLKFNIFLYFFLSFLINLVLWQSIQHYFSSQYIIIIIIIIIIIVIIIINIIK